MLTALLEKKTWFSWIIYKIGMPLVFFYHALLSNVFINTAAEDATGLEKWANTVLIPTQYFLEGKKAIPILDENQNLTYTLERRFDYANHFFLKTALSITTLPFSITVGGALKSLAYLSPETKERAKKISAAVHSRKVFSNLEYYRSIGMEIENFETAEWISPPKYKRPPHIKNNLSPDVEALKEIVQILQKENIPFWIDCGSCLGAYQYGGCIPHDWDIDIGVLLPDFDNLKNALQELDPKKFVVQDWSGRDHPKSYLKVFVHESGGMIDLYHFAVDPEKKQISTLLSNENNIFLPKSWKIREKRYTIPMPFAYIFPCKKALFEGIEVPVPGQIENYLQTFYGENLAPARGYNEITGNYEKDPTHPYWQLPHAH